MNLGMNNISVELLFSKTVFVFILKYNPEITNETMIAKKLSR